MSSFALSARRLACAALLSVSVAGAAAPAASAATPDVTLKVSTRWAVVGFPVTATVTSTEPGTLYLSQLRNDGWRATGSGYCGHPGDSISRDLSVRTIPAGTTKITIQPAKLLMLGGELFSFGKPCWDQATPFDRLRASVYTADASNGFATVPFQRVL